MTLLSGPEIKPANGEPPEQIIMFLHGYGANGDDLIDLSRYVLNLFPGALFASPNAPARCEMSPMGYQWFSLANRDPHAMLKEIKNAAVILNDHITALLRKHGLSEENLALIGFSQGTMMALEVALRREKPVAGIVGFSGRLLAPELLPHEMKSRPPVCLIHGDADPVVPHFHLKEADDALRAEGVEVESHSRPRLPHSIDPEGIAIARRFLEARLK